MKEMLEIGVHAALFNFGNLWVSIPMWLSIIVGFTVQYLLLKKCSSLAKWIFMGTVLLAVLGFELFSHIITGWELLALLIFYGFAFAMLVGALIATAVYYIKKRTS